MRVFDVYYFNIIDKVKYKDTRKYIEKMLKELGLKYNNISFTFESFGDGLDKVIEEYPNFQKYRYRYYQYGGDKNFILTSLTPNWTNGDIHADVNDWEDIFSITSKPRTYKVYSTVIFDQIDWYGEGIKEPTYEVSEIRENKAMLCSRNYVLNNQIEIGKHYSSGNKYNSVHVVIESTTDGKPRDTTDIIKKLEPYFGTASKPVRKIRFSKEQSKIYHDRERECEKIIEKMLDEFYPDVRQDENVEFIPNLANKKKIEKAFKNTDFVMGDRKSLLPGMNCVTCIDKHNFKFEIMFDRTQSCPNCFCLYVGAEGCNFKVRNLQKVIYASSHAEAEEMIGKIADFCMKFKDEFGDILEENFGNTPEWYTYD